MKDPNNNKLSEDIQPPESSSGLPVYSALRDFLIYKNKITDNEAEDTIYVRQASKS